MQSPKPPEYKVRVMSHEEGGRKIARYTVAWGSVAISGEPTLRVVTATSNSIETRCSRVPFGVSIGLEVGCQAQGIGCIAPWEGFSIYHGARRAGMNEQVTSTLMVLLMVTAFR